jgi:hypothetical protein
MPKKSTKSILAALKKAGLAIEADDLDKVTEALEDLELSAEEYLSGDQVILSKDEKRELKDDLTKLRQRMKKAEKERDDLREAMDSGDSDNARKATQYKRKLDELEPTLKKLLEVQRITWTSASTRIPDTVKKEFHFAEEGKELSTDQILHNVEKLEEYTRIGIIEGGEGGPGDGKGGEGDGGGPPDAPRPQPGKRPEKLTPDQMNEMRSADLVEAGYKPRPAPKTD